MSIHSITVTDLLSLSRPLTGAASLSPYSNPSPLKKHKPQPSPLPSHTLQTTTNSNLFFTPFTHPTLLIATVDLPIDPHNPFLSISEGSSTISCAVLDFDLSIIGHIIHVLAWNFLPFERRGGGLLEVIRWSITFPSLSIPKDMSTLSLQKGFLERKTIVGVLISVSPVFTVPCRNQGPGVDSVGFLADIYTCNCRLCTKLCSFDGFGCSIWKGNTHCFSVSKFVYFVVPASTWRLALAKLAGKVVVVSGLKKKMIFVGEKTSYAMYTTTSEASVSSCRFPVGVCARVIGEGTVYDGVVTGVYMQGMVVELDDRVWLLVTDPNLVPLASLRVGAIISVRNIELFHPILSWIETNLLVSCCRTIIDVKAFSISDTRCHLRSQSQSLLEKFIGTLIPTARFWVLLLISCFRKKFANILSNKEILGSRNKEGIVQVYACASLLPHFFQSQHGIFMEFCQHRQSASNKEKDETPFKLVVPISNLKSKCEVMWESLIREIQCDDEDLSIGWGVPCEGIPSTPVIRRIISSDILGCILMGSIKTTSSGKLQLFDATGSVDIVVPDIFPSFNCQGIHEVKEFKVVLEGSFMQVESSELHSEPFSCKSIFGELPENNKINNLAVYVHFYFKDSTCLKAPINFPLCKVNYFSTSDSGITHLLLVTHKFPAVETYVVHTNASNGNSLFAEALLLPYDANFVDENAHDHVPYELNNPEMKNCRRSKVVESRRHSYTSSNCHLSPGTRPDFPCLLTFPKSSPQVHVTGNLCRKGSSVLGNNSAGFHPILLEFLSDSFVKYQSLIVGGYYIMMCSKECGFCFHNDGRKQICAKVILSSKTILWKVSFSFGMGQPKKEQPIYENSGDDDSVRAHQIRLGNACQNDLVFQQPCTQLNDSSDAHLLISPDMLGSINQIEALKEEICSHFSILQGAATVSSFIQIMKSDISRSLKCAGSQHGSLFNTELISVCGNIESLHLFNCKFRSFVCKESSAFDCKRESSICLHVYDDQNMIHIRGKLRRSYPVGLGPGVNATFHRVLVKCYPGGFPKLFLTSVSLIVINSVKETSFLCRNRPALLPQFDRNSEHSLNSVSLKMISQFNDLLDIKLARLLCRVVTIHFLVLERLELDSRRPGSGIGSKMPSITIRLAGFLLDDGSSLCCCWADGKRAEALLRLDEILCQPFFQCGVASARKAVGCHDTVGFQLDKLLRKHHKVIMKNYRAAQDVSCIDFMFYCDSSEILSNAEESLLRFVFTNACQGSAFNLAGHLMDSTTLRSLPKECEDVQDIVRPLTNIWAAEIEHINYLKQARDLLDDLSTGR